MINSRQPPRAHVVIVDDESITRKLLSSFLKRDAYHLYEAATGQYLLDHIDEWRPDVILLDVLMPGMDGYTVCRKLRSDARWRHIPIIMITALNRHEEMVKGLQVGADEFLTKPVSGLALLARVQSMLRIKRQYDELRSAIQFRDALVDTLVHDMRNSMSVVSLKGQRVLRRPNLEAADRSAVESIVQQIGYLDTFITDLSLITQLETHKIRPDRVPIDLSSFVTELVESHRAAAKARGQTIEVTVSTVNYKTLADRHLMERLLHNLLASIMKHSAGNSVITLHLQGTEIRHDETQTVAGTRMVLGNYGPSVSNTERKALVDSTMPMRNTHASNAAKFGMELALVDVIVNAHNGHTWIEDNAPHGVIFYLEWPDEETN